MRTRKARSVRVVRLSRNGMLDELKERFKTLARCHLERTLLGRRDVAYDVTYDGFVRFRSVWLRAQLPCGRVARRCDRHLAWGMR